MIRVAVHEIQDESVLVDTLSYSKFKHGDKQTTINYAKALAEKLVEALHNTPLDTEIYITGAPYNQVPVASTYLAHYTAMYLRAYGYEAIREFKINRQHSYHQDYGLMCKEDRDKSISGETFYTDVSILQAKKVIFVDDVLITGSHERRIMEMIERLDLNCNSIFAYYAAFVGECCRPQVEHDMNSHMLNEPLDFIQHFSQKNLLLNTRATKYLLACLDFVDIMVYMRKQVKIELYRFALANGYHKLPQYESNFYNLQDNLRKWI